MSNKLKMDINKIYKTKLKILNVLEHDIAEQILKDSNKYIPVDSSKLRDSGKVEKKNVIWDTPYALKQYYEIPEKTSVNNTNATWRWYETAKAKHGGDWLKLAHKRGMNVKRG